MAQYISIKKVDNGYTINQNEYGIDKSYPMVSKVAATNVETVKIVAELLGVSVIRYGTSDQPAGVDIQA